MNRCYAVARSRCNASQAIRFSLITNLAPRAKELLWVVIFKHFNLNTAKMVMSTLAIMLDWALAFAGVTRSFFSRTSKKPDSSFLRHAESR